MTYWLSWLSMSESIDHLSHSIMTYGTDIVTQKTIWLLTFDLVWLGFLSLFNLSMVSYFSQTESKQEEQHSHWEVSLRPATFRPLFQAWSAQSIHQAQAGSFGTSRIHRPSRRCQSRPHRPIGTIGNSTHENTEKWDCHQHFCRKWDSPSELTRTNITWWHTGVKHLFFVRKFNFHGFFLFGEFEFWCLKWKNFHGF